MYEYVVKTKQTIEMLNHLSQRLPDIEKARLKLYVNYLETDLREHFRKEVAEYEANVK